MRNNLAYNPLAKVEVTKEITFDSAHFLKDYIGACSHLHGHTYRLQVTVEGVCNKLGLVVDFKDLKLLLDHDIQCLVDHTNINDVFKELGVEANTTAENMVVFFYNILKTSILNLSKSEGRYIKLKSVKLWETPTSFATFKGYYCEPVKEVFNE